MSTNDEEIEFNSHKWVWLSDKTKTFVRGFVLEDDLDSGTKLKIRTEDDKDVIVMKDEVQEVNPPKFNNADDMAELTHLNEPSVLYNLQRRYMNDFIYTYSGLFLVAVNPYADVPIYGPDYVDMYNGGSQNDAKPHIFAITDLTYRYMLEKQQNQSILVTGESGAGKTENTKKIIQYLAAITTSHKESNSANSDLAKQVNFEEQIIQANPILESFGNAQTVRNNNSSRFGKFIRIEFSGKGSISGANIDWYLLEKSRVIHQASNERNYHIFYQLLLGLSKSEKEQLYINENAKFFNYLKNGNTTIPNVDDKKEFRNLIYAFETMHFSKEDYWEIFKTISIILLIGNITFISRASDKARFSDDSPLKELCDLLQTDLESFKQAIIAPKVKAGKEFVTQNRTGSQARFSLDAISKSLYERTFKFIVDKINDKLDHSLSSLNFIGVLDIAGFEIFKQNSFEQLCINYTNEKLQQFFNHHMFILEQNEYLKENINWRFIDYGQDLQETIDLIESHQNPIGVLSVLNEECIVPKSSDKSFIDKLNTLWDKKSTKFKKSRYDNGFTIKHYAAEVEYTTDGWLDKNRDPLNQNLLELLVKSSNKHISSLFADDAVVESQPAAGGKKFGSGNGAKGGMFRTVAHRHKEQLGDLMSTLSNTYPHFVRCILPNNKKRPHELDKKLVLEQLRCNGVLEGIRIARAGYPNRIFFKEFYQRYKFLAKQLQVFGSNNDFKKNSEIILKSLNLDSEVYKVGLTKIFFKNGILAQLETKREAVIKNIFIEIQSVIRGSLKRRNIKRELQKVQSAQVIMKNFLIYNELKKNEWYNLMIKVKPLLDSSKQQKQKQLVMDQVNKLKEQMIELENKNREIAKEKEELQHEMKKLGEVLTTERALLAEKDHELANTRKKEIELSQSIQQHTNKMTRLEEELAQIKSVKAQLGKKLESSKTEYDARHKKIEELESHKKSLADEKARLQKELKKANSDVEVYKKENSAQLELKIKSATTTLNLEVKKLTNENKDLKEQLVKLKESSTKLELARSTKSRDLDSLNRTIESQKKQIDQLVEEKIKIFADYAALQKEFEKAQAGSESITSKFKKLEADALEAKNLLKIKIADDIKFDRGKQKFDNEILELKHTKKLIEKELEELREENADLQSKLNSGEVDKAAPSSAHSKDLDPREVNILAGSNDQKLVSAYNDMKLQLNEKSALLNHVSQERKRIEEELKILQTRLASESFDNQKLNAQLRKFKKGSRINFQETSFSNDFLNHSSDLVNEEDLAKNNERLVKELAEARAELELERKATKKAEDFAMDLQKQLKTQRLGNGQLIDKFNSLSGASRKNEDFNDIYKIKFENAETRVKSLEKQLREIKDYYKSSFPIQENFNVQNTINSDNGNGSAAFDKGLPKEYQDIVKKYKASKQEVSSLKKMLNDVLSERNDSRNRLYEEGDSSREFILQEELVTNRLRLESSQGKIDELTKQVILFKERSEEYFEKLEIAEQAVRSSKRAEKHAKQELKEVSSILKSIKQDERSTEAQLAKMKLKINQMETKVQSKETEIKRLKTTQQTLTEELEHYRFKLVTDSKYNNKDKKFEELNKQLKEKLIVETALKKELKVSKMLLENALKEKEENEIELDRWRRDKGRIIDRNTELESDLSRYRYSEKENKKKLDSLLQQINTLHEAMDRMINERELIQKDKRLLEEKIEDLIDNHDSNDALAMVLDQQKQEIERNRDELESHYQVEKAIKQELMEEKEKITMVIEENKGLENLIKQLQSHIKDLEIKSKENADDEFYIKRIQELEDDLKEYEKNEDNIHIMERLVRDLNSKLEASEKEKIQILKENEEIEKRTQRLKESLEKLEESESRASLAAKRAERELKEQKEAKIRSEMDLINWKNRLSKFANRKQV